MKRTKLLLEDLIVSAINKGIKKAKNDSQEKMSSITGGMMGGLRIPGI